MLYGAMPAQSSTLPGRAGWQKAERDLHQLLGCLCFLFLDHYFLGFHGVETVATVDGLIALGLERNDGHCAASFTGHRSSAGRVNALSLQPRQDAATRTSLRNVS